MKALVCRAAGEIEFVDAPAPAPAPGESLIKVDSCGVCGSDMHAFLGHDERRPPPLILGHEAAGEVVGGEKLGARVAVNPLVVCDFLSPHAPCAMCAAGRDNLCARRQILSMAPRPGAFAEFVCAPADNLFELPPSFPFAKAALFEPLACGRRAARLAAELSPTAIEKCETARHRRRRDWFGLRAFFGARGRGARRDYRGQPFASKNAFAGDGFRRNRCRRPRRSRQFRSLCACRRRCGRKRKQPRSRVWACRSGRLDCAYRLGRRRGRSRFAPLDIARDCFLRLLHIHQKGLRRNGARLLGRRVGRFGLAANSPFARRRGRFRRRRQRRNRRAESRLVALITRRILYNQKPPAWASTNQTEKK